MTDRRATPSGSERERAGFDSSAVVPTGVPGREPVEKTDALRAALSWLTPFARLAAVVASVLVLNQSAGDEGLDLDVLTLLLHVVGA